MHGNMQTVLDGIVWQVTSGIVNVSLLKVLPDLECGPGLWTQQHETKWQLIK